MCHSVHLLDVTEHEKFARPFGKAALDSLYTLAGAAARIYDRGGGGGGKLVV